MASQETAARPAPIALLSGAALAANRAMISERDTPVRVDLSADAWGHGAAFLSEALGADLVAVQDHSDNPRLLGLEPGFRPVMTLRSEVLSTKPLRAGEGVSYGYTHRAPQDTVLALVAGGYATGVPRALGNRASVIIAGLRHPIVGRVAMDVCMVDIGEAEVGSGETVEFFGEELSVAHWAAATGLTAAELVTAVGLRVHRRVDA